MGSPIEVTRRKSSFTPLIRRVNMFTIEARPYFEILHTLIRHDDDPKALEQLPGAMAWLDEHLPLLSKVCSHEERAILQHLHEYWAKHGRNLTPSRKALEDV